MILHPWEPGLDRKDEAFGSTRCWIQVWHIPNHWLSLETGWKVGNLFKKCYNVVIPKTGSKDSRHIKLLIELKLNKPLLRGTNLKFEGESTWIEFRYE